MFPARTFSTGSETLYTTNGQEGNFEKAKATCIQAGGHIPSPQKEGDNKSLQDVVKRRSKPAFIHVPQGAGYTNWAAGVTDNADGINMCAEIGSDGKWRVSSCEQAHLFVCSFPPPPVTLTLA